MREVGSPMETDRRFATNGRKYQIQRLWEIHHEICRMAILGMKSVNIATYLGITEATVSTCLNSAVVKQHLHIMRMARDASSIDVAKQIQELAPKALEVLEGVLAGTRDATLGQQIGVAEDILDRAGHVPPRVIKGEFAHAYLTKEDIEDIKRNARENKALAEAVDVEVVAQTN